MPLYLDPDNAAKSIAVRVKNIADAEQYIRETMARYAGLKALDDALAAAGIAEAVAAVVAKPAPAKE